jgi:hypothetical protein
MGPPHGLQSEFKSQTIDVDCNKFTPVSLSIQFHAIGLVNGVASGLVMVFTAKLVLKIFKKGEGLFRWPPKHISLNIS